MSALRIALVLATAVALGAAWWALDAMLRIPSFDSVRERSTSSEAVLLDRHGVVIHERRVDPTRRCLGWTALGDVSPAVVRALLAAEDRRFYSHPGVDPRSVAAAALEALRGNRPRGASTISMQLAALLDPGPREGRKGPRLLRKFAQMRSALALERRWSKAQILEAYLDLVSFRGELQGIAAATRGLFGREPTGLGTSQALVLAALIRAPNAPADLVAKRACRLGQQIDADVSCEEISETAVRALAQAPAPPPQIALAPHLAAHLLPTGSSATRVSTTLDGHVQRFVASALERQVLALAGRNVRDAAALVVDNASGDVLAYVGSSGAPSSAGQVDGVRARRQAGSALKPFLYGEALDERLVTTSTRLDDTPLDVVTALGSYRPADYDRGFRGPVSVREALASSLNIPAVRLLGQVGVDRFVATLRRAGFDGLREPDFYGDSLALGSADVSLWELVGAWRALAREGSYEPLRVSPEDPATPPGRLFSAEAAFLVLDVLADRASRAPSFGLESALATRSWSAVKTGTSKDMRDNWCVGASDRFTVGVWVGNFSGAPMWDVSGVDGAAPAWVEIMDELHRDSPSAAPTPPAGLVRMGSDWYLTGTEPAALYPPELERVSSADVVLTRIASPATGTLFALDPDVPKRRQRVLIQASAADARLELRLDGRRLGSAAKPILWEPRRGRHHLALLGPDGGMLDAANFTVR